MGARLTQRPIGDVRTWSVGWTLKRGAVVVDLIDDAPKSMPVTGGIGHIAWDFDLPVTVPASGVWTLDCPILSEFPDQGVGTVSFDDSVYPATMSAGYILTAAPIPAGAHVSLRGMVRVQ